MTLFEYSISKWNTKMELKMRFRFFLYDLLMISNLAPFVFMFMVSMIFCSLFHFFLSKTIFVNPFFLLSILLIAVIIYDWFFHIFLKKLLEGNQRYEKRFEENDDNHMIEIMKERRSTRAYQRRYLDPVDQKYVKRIVFEVNKENEIVENGIRVFNLKDELCCTFITDCLQFLVCTVPKKFNNEHFIDSGRIMQHIVLKLTKNGISTSFIGGFKRDQVNKSLERNFKLGSENNHHIAIVVAIGYRSKYLPFMVQWVMNNSVSRLPFEKLFFIRSKEGETVPFTKQQQQQIFGSDEPTKQKILSVLDAVRWSPASSNKQSLRVIVNITSENIEQTQQQQLEEEEEEDTNIIRNIDFHFYKSGPRRAFESYSLLGIGTALRSFETACSITTSFSGVVLDGEFVKDDPEIKFSKTSSLHYLSTYTCSTIPSHIMKKVLILKFEEDEMTERSIQKYAPDDGVVVFEYRIMGNYKGDISKNDNLQVLLGQIQRCLETYKKKREEEEDKIPLSAISISCMSLGAVCDPEIVFQMIHRIFNDHVKCTLPALASLSALKDELKVKRICLVTPYTEQVAEKVKLFFTRNSIEVLTVSCFGESTGNGFSSIDPERILEKSVEMVREVNKAREEEEDDDEDSVGGVYLSCTAFNVMGILEEIERRTGVFAVSSNQVQLWMLLRLSGYSKPVQNLGELLRRL